MLSKLTSNERNALGKKNVLIINHLSLNKGNHAVLRTIIQELRTIYKGSVNIMVSSDDDELTRTRDGVEAFIWPVNVKRIRLKKNIVSKSFIAVCELLSSSFLLWLPFLTKKGKTIAEYYRKADLIISPGGHLFTSMNNILLLWNYTLLILLNKRFHKPLIGLAQSVGPFRGRFAGISKMLATQAIRNMDIILLRESKSVEVLQKLGFSSSKYAMAGEIVYLLRGSNRGGGKPLVISNGIRVGVAIHHIYYKYFMSRTIYINIMSNFLDSILEMYGNMNIVFVPMEYTNEGPRDRIIIQEIIARMKHKDNVEIMEKDFQPEEIVSFMEQLDFFIGTKTHSVVMALQSTVPTLSISYHEKSRFFMGEWGVGDYSIYLKDITAEKLIKLFDNLYQNKRDIKELLMHKKEEILFSSQKNIEIISFYLK